MSKDDETKPLLEVLEHISKEFIAVDHISDCDFITFDKLYDMLTELMGCEIDKADLNATLILNYKHEYVGGLGRVLYLKKV